MISLLWFLMAWFAVVGLVLLISLFTTSLAARFGLTGSNTLVLCGIFLLVTGVIILGAGSYLLTVDWSQSISLNLTGAYNDGLLLP